MLNFKAYTGQRIGLSISKIYLHSNECELVIKVEDFILVLPYFLKSAIWAHCVALQKPRSSRVDGANRFLDKQ